jgi:hypothetical protein
MLTVEVDACNCTASAGDAFEVAVEIKNNGTVADTFPVSAALPAGVIASEWEVIFKPAGTSQTINDGTEMVGAYLDTVTLPPSGEVLLKFRLKTSHTLADGTIIPFIVLVDGVPYTKGLEIRHDLFCGQRGKHNAVDLLSVLLGGCDDPIAASANINRLQDEINRGLRLWHVVADVGDRRGYGVKENACGSTELATAPAGFSTCPPKEFGRAVLASATFTL